MRDPSRVAEVLNRVILKAKRLSAPAQINIPRDFWTQVIDINLPAIVEFERPAGGDGAVSEAAKLLSEAKFPVILSGAGVVLGNAIEACTALAEKLDAPVCNNYQHNDSFPGSHRLAVGPLGYNGSKAAMELIAKADVVLALGTRLNPFSTLPGYGIDYWPKTAKIIQVDINADRIGLTKPVTVGICGDARLVAEADLARLSPTPAMPAARSARRCRTRPSRHGCRRCRAWTMKTTIRARPGTRTRASATSRADVAAPGLARDPGGSAARRHHLQRHRQQLRDRQRLSDVREGPQISGAGPVRPVRLRISVDHRRQDRQSRHALRRLRRRRRVRHLDERDELDRPQGMAGRSPWWCSATTSGAPRSATRSSGTTTISSAPNSIPISSYAKVAEGCGLKGVTVKTQAELTEALRKSCEDQKKGVTTFIEVMLNQELGEPFRRDAMKKPVVVAGIKREDMRPQKTPSVRKAYPRAHRFDVGFD